ncbi:MAG: RloB domain-containing protein [Lachnospiraceae bacterium]|nr:RloB domain-containing protein [Lachnospiraceae bacterium]
MANKYRLSSQTYDRETPNEQIAPKKIYFISVEGVATEVEYLRGLSDYRAELGINSLVNIEVLRRKTKDGYSAPDQVIELLEEYLNLRETGDDIFLDIPDEIKNNFTPDFIQLYLEAPKSISSKERNEFELALRKTGYDLAYRKYLSKYNNDFDKFCILIDRDAGSHSSEEMRFILQYCNESNYRCFITNPCFEFWLLLHFSDVYEEYSDRLDLIRENKKISNAHTYVSNELSLKAHHGKKGLAFKEKYLPHIEEAIIRASKFKSDNESLITDIGCNIWKLIREMQSFDKK